MYVLCMRHVCGKGKVREGGRGAAQRRGTMVTSVLAAAEGLRGELAEVLRGRDVR